MFPVLCAGRSPRNSHWSLKPGPGFALLHGCRERPTQIKPSCSPSERNVWRKTRAGSCSLPPSWAEHKAWSQHTAGMTVLKAGRWQQLPWETQHHPSWAPGHQDCGAVKDPAQHTCSFLVLHHSPRPAFWTLSSWCPWLGPWWSLSTPPWLALPQEETAREGGDRPWTPALHLPGSVWACSHGGYWGQSHRSIRLHTDTSIGTANRQV